MLRFSLLSESTDFKLTFLNWHFKLTLTPTFSFTYGALDIEVLYFAQDLCWINPPDVNYCLIIHSIDCINTTNTKTPLYTHWRTHGSLHITNMLDHVDRPDTVKKRPWQLYNTACSCFTLVPSRWSWECMCQWSTIDVNSWVLQMCNRIPHTTSLHDQDAKTCNQPYAPLSMRGGTTSYIPSISSTPQTQNRIQGSLHVTYMLPRPCR